MCSQSYFRVKNVNIGWLLKWSLYTISGRGSYGMVKVRELLWLLQSSYSWLIIVKDRLVKHLVLVGERLVVIEEQTLIGSEPLHLSNVGIAEATSKHFETDNPTFTQRRVGCAEVRMYAGLELFSSYTIMFASFLVPHLNDYHLRFKQTDSSKVKSKTERKRCFLRFFRLSVI